MSLASPGLGERQGEGAGRAAGAEPPPASSLSIMQIEVSVSKKEATEDLGLQKQLDMEALYVTLRYSSV